MTSITTALNATIQRREDLNERYRIFDIQPAPGAPIEFEPGQFLTLGLPADGNIEEEPGAGRAAPADEESDGLIRRPFSIASAAFDTARLQVLFHLIEDGRFSSRLAALGEGDPIWLDRRARGTFTLERVPRNADLLMVASGDGLSPFMSMIRTYRSASRWRRLILIHAVEEEHDLAYRDELESIAETDDAFTYLPRTGHDVAGREWDELHQEIDAALGESTSIRLDPEFDPGKAHVLLCGNPYLIDSSMTLLRNYGLTAAEAGRPGRVYYERYWEAARW